MTGLRCTIKGKRQSGKTTTLIRTAKAYLKKGKTVLFLTRHAKEVREELKNVRSKKNLKVIGEECIKGWSVDCLLIDEIQTFSKEYIFGYTYPNTVMRMNGDIYTTETISANCGIYTPKNKKEVITTRKPKPYPARCAGKNSKQQDKA